MTVVEEETLLILILIFQRKIKGVLFIVNKKFLEIKNYDYIVDTDTDVDIAYYIYQKLLMCGKEQAIAPKNIGFRITNKCLFDCDDCFVKKRNNDLTYSKFIKIMEKFPQKPFYVYLTGADPFLNKDIFLMIDYLYRKNIKINIHSTGIVKNMVLNEIMHNSHKIDSIQISIDSISNFTKYRCTNTKKPLDEIRRFISYLKDSIHLKVNFVLRKDNKEEIYEVIDFCEKNRIEELSISPIITHDKDKIVYDDISYYHRIIRYISGKNVVLDSEPFCHCMSFNFKHLKNLEKVERFYCPADKTECEVDMSGNVYPCPFLYNENYIYGNLLKNDFDEIWNNDNKLANLLWTKLDKCIQCVVLDKCGRGCYAYAYINGEKFDKRCNI